MLRLYRKGCEARPRQSSNSRHTFKMFCWVILVVVGAGHSLAATQDQLQSKSALPNPVTYFKLPEAKREGEVPAQQERDPRFGIQLGYGNDLQGYSGGTGLSGGYTPVKIDLGGLILGTVIGFGAVLLAPKLLHLFSPPHHPIPYARSEDETGGGGLLESVSGALSKLEERLKEEGVSGSACLGRAVCHLAQASSPALHQQLSNSSLTIVHFLTAGSEVGTALDRGIAGKDCAAAYPNCNINPASLLNDNKL